MADLGPIPAVRLLPLLRLRLGRITTVSIMMTTMTATSKRMTATTLPDATTETKTNTERETETEGRRLRVDAAVETPPPARVAIAATAAALADRIPTPTRSNLRDHNDREGPLLLLLLDRPPLRSVERPDPFTAATAGMLPLLAPDGVAVWSRRGATAIPTAATKARPFCPSN